MFHSILKLLTIKKIIRTLLNLSLLITIPIQLSSTRGAFPESVWITYGGNNSSSLLSPPPPSSCNISSHDGLLTIQADPRVVLDEDTLTINTSSEIRQLERVREKVVYHFMWLHMYMYEVVKMVTQF